MALIKSDSGCKVGWETYDNKEEAEARAERAKVEARERASRGYDFGYQSPGSVEQVRQYPVDADGKTDYANPVFLDQWVVTIP